MILEGSNLLCKFLKPPLENSLSIVINIPEEAEHLNRIMGQSASRSVYKLDNFEKIRHLQNYFVDQARRNGHLVIDNISAESTIPKIIELL